MQCTVCGSSKLVVDRSNSIAKCISCGSRFKVLSVNNAAKPVQKNSPEQLAHLLKMLGLPDHEPEPVHKNSPQQLANLLKMLGLPEHDPEPVRPAVNHSSVSDVIAKLKAENQMLKDAVNSHLDSINEYGAKLKEVTNINYGLRIKQDEILAEYSRFAENKRIEIETIKNCSAGSKYEVDALKKQIEILKKSNSELARLNADYSRIEAERDEYKETAEYLRDLFVATTKETPDHILREDYKRLQAELEEAWAMNRELESENEKASYQLADLVMQINKVNI